MGRWKDPRKNHEVTIAIAIARCKQLEADTSPSIAEKEMHIATTVQ